MKIYFELADVFGDDVDTKPFMRLCVGLEEKFPNIRGWQLRKMKVLCDVVSKEENRFFMFEGVWLKTTVSLKDPESFFYGETRVHEILQEASIRRNVIPGAEYLMRLQDFCHRSDWTREFYSHRILKESLDDDKLLSEKLKDRRKQWQERRKQLKDVDQRKGGDSQCELAMSLQRRTESNREAASEIPRSVEFVELVPGKKLAEGGEGTVWEVEWGNCTYAMKKFINEGPYINEHAVAEMRKVLHPHIVHSFGHPPEDFPPGDSFLLMELLDGDLSHLIYEDERAKTIQLTEVERLDMLVQIASAMSKLHENNVVHGDLKPENILYSELELSGNVRYFLAKVADFGSAQIIIDPTSRFMPRHGTTRYAAPEVLRLTRCGDEGPEADAKLDVYSFGVLAYEILTGKRAFDGLLRNEQMKDVSTGKKKLIDCIAEWKKLKVHGFQYTEEVFALVESCLEFDPLKRPTFSTICDALNTYKSTHQNGERIVAAYQKIFVIIVKSFIFLLLCLWG